MHDLTLHIITVFMGFFAIMNPLGNLSIFLSMVEGMDPRLQRQIAFKASLTAFTIVTVFCVFGHFIFKLFGITLPAFEIAGGIIVFFIGYQLLNAKTNTLHRDPNISPEQIQKQANDLAIAPLGIPLMAGPGTISAAMNFVGAEKSIWNVLLVVGVFLFMCVLTYIVFISGKKLTSKLDPGIIKAISRIMGLILTIIAVQMVISGVYGAIHLFP
ncbi:MAG: MarC family protein [Bacteroidales bacterium]|nr:MarC family protein [Bacteroidales bacterium]